jgi:hypothetical protein
LEVVATRFNEIVQLKGGVGQSLTVGDATVTPLSQALVIRVPFGSFAWNRPTAILVERNGQTERIPIVNVTRILVWGLLGIGLAVAILSPRRADRRKESE